MRVVIRFVLAVVAVLVLAAVCLPFLVSADRFKPVLEAKLAGALGRQVTIGDLKLSVFSGGVSADDLAIADDPAFSRKPFLRAKSLTVGVDLWTLATSRKLIVRSLTIDQPEVTLLQSDSGAWNFSTMGGRPAHASAGARLVLASYGNAPEAAIAAPGNPNLSVQLLKISGGRFSLGKTSGHQKPLALAGVEIQVQDFSSASAFPFSFAAKVSGGGTIKLDGKAGPIDSGNVVLTPAAITLDVAALDLAATPLAAQSPGLARIVSFHGTGNSTGGRVSPAALCATLTRPMVKATGGNVYVRANAAPALITWSPSAAEGCISKLGSLDEFHKLAPEFETGGRILDATLRSLFKGPDVGRYELRQPLPAAGAVALPADIQKLLGWSEADARIAGAFPVRR